MNSATKVQKAHESMWRIAEQRSAENMALGDETRDWEEVAWQELQSLRAPITVSGFPKT